MINDEADEVIQELLNSLKSRNQNNLQSLKIWVSLRLCSFIVLEMS